METLHNISSAGNKSHISVRVRSVLTLVGIVTAIICALVFFEELHATERAETSSPKPAISKVVNGNLIVKAASSIWSFRKQLN